MGLIGFALICLIVGALIFALGCLLFYLVILAIGKILDILDLGCGCLGLIVIGFVALFIIDLLF